MNWYNMQAKSNHEAEILIYEQIGASLFSDGIDAKKFAQELNSLGDIRKLNVRINSPGGSVFDGNAIYNILRSHKALVNVFIDGIAASIASVIAMAGDVITMPENAMLMIHDPSGLVQGTSDDMEKMAEALSKIKVGLISAYRQKTGLSDNEISNMMANETWLTAAEAVDKGFADITSPAIKMAACFDLSGYKNTPKFIGGLASNTINTESAVSLSSNQELIQRVEQNKMSNSNDFYDEYSINIEAEQEWKSDVNIRLEFYNNFEQFCAYKHAVAKGWVAEPKT